MTCLSAQSFVACFATNPRGLSHKPFKAFLP